MRDFFRSKTFLFLLAAAGLSFAVFCFTAFTEGKISATSNITGILITPIQKGTTGVAGFVDNIYGYLYRYDSLQEENKKLKEELQDTKNKLQSAQEAAEENTHLRELLGLKQKNKSFDLEMAEIIASSTGNWNTALTIDKGSLSGIKVNDCVITEDGMVGYISEVGTTFSEVVTVIDPTMQAGAIVSRTRDVAVAQGSFDLMDQGMLKLSYIKKDSDIMEGDTVETSGLGGVFPKGIIIGTVQKILPEPHGISNYAVIKPAVNLNKISKVFIVKSFKITE
ncbi:MAG: rod shape-determining protein MreC [Clostridiales bacterium]|nr:rod shape-determining protein MreC [Clostridiales bacterium]